MLVPNRHGNSPAYRYGFQGQEKDDELKGEGNSYDFGARMLDPRVGRWFAPDKAENKFPNYSTYNFVLNNPLTFVDPDGKSPFDWCKDKFRNFVYNRNVKSQTDLFSNEKYVGATSQVVHFKGDPEEGWKDTFQLNAVGTVISNLGVILNYNFGRHRVGKTGLSLINEYIVEEKYEDFVAHANAYHVCIQGEKGFHKFGDDLSKSSTYVKIFSGILAIGSAATGQAEGVYAAEIIYSFGDQMDNASTLIQVHKDYVGVKGKTNYKNIFANLSLSVSNEIINNKIGDLEDIQDVSKIVTSVSNDIVIDQMKGAVMDADTLNNTPDKNKTKE